MEVGGIKTKWLFVDMLEANKEYIGEVSGLGKHKCRDGKTEMEYLIWTGTLSDGIPAEYQVSVWNIESKQKFDPDKPGRWQISRRHNSIFFEPA